jgi:triosephosphate isomerase
MKYVIANWKMQLNTSDIDDWFHDFPKDKKNNVEVIIAASHIHLAILRTIVKFYPFNIGAQDVSIATKGAHTGEVGAFQLKDFCNYCIVGHSERGETLDTVLKKRDMCLDTGITPIVCFVEPKTAADVYTKGVILAKEDPKNISVEGKYRNEASDQVKVDFEIIRGLVPSEASVVYGGSVNRQNATELFNISGLDGVLVGNASLDPVHLTDIIKAFSI